MFEAGSMAPSAGDGTKLHQHNRNYDPYFFFIISDKFLHRNTYLQLRFIVVFFFFIGMLYLHDVIRFQNSATTVPTEFPVISSSHQTTVIGTGVSQKLL